MSNLSICVYCGSRSGRQDAYQTAAQQVGHLIGERGWKLVYGGGRAGLMGTVADAALAAGAHVTGVIPRSLLDRELAHPGLSELHVVETMHERKKLMAEKADAFLALPGGLGTLEELFEVWTWLQLGYHRKPIGLLNTKAYYDGLLAFLNTTTTEGFVSQAQQQLLKVCTDPVEIVDTLITRSQRTAHPNDYRQI